MARQKKWVLQLYELANGTPHLYAPERNDMTPPKPFSPTPGYYYGSRYNYQNPNFSAPTAIKVLHVFEDTKVQAVIRLVSDTDTPERVKGGTWEIKHCSIPELDGLSIGVSRNFLVDAVNSQVIDKGEFRADFKFRRYKYGRVILELDE